MDDMLGTEQSKSSYLKIIVVREWKIDVQVNIRYSLLDSIEKIQHS
jgi:hypothetical protein